VKPLYLFLTVAYCGVLFWLSSGPLSLPGQIEFSGVDKIEHMGAYGLLALIVARGMQQSGRKWSRFAIFFIPVFFVALYGASDELHQLCVPSRSCDIFDWLSDLTGAAVAASGFAWWFYRPIREPLGVSEE
jgi:VanZ family protein